MSIVTTSVDAESLPALTAHFTVRGDDRSIPRSFLGLSVEYNELRTYEREGSVFARVLSMVRPEDGSPLLLRVGGRSADSTLWQSTPGAGPEGVSLIGQRWLARLRTLVVQDRLRVMLDVNLAVHAPTVEARFAAAARRALPAGSVAGVEIGNEPDLYSGQPQLARERVRGTDVGPEWTKRYSPRDYRRDYRDYARALVASAPGVALAGPDTLFSPDPAWLSAVSGLGHLSARIVAVHRYVSTNCLPQGSRSFLSVGTMLGSYASAGLASSLIGPVALARSHGESVHITEVNSISCGGTPGVSDSFATALWAPDLLFGFLRAGVNGVNWETRPGQVNAPFLAAAHSVHARPSLYGLAAFAQMTRPGAELLRASLSVSAGLDVTGWAVRVAGGMRVLLINKGSRLARVTVSTGITGHAFLKRLIAPGVYSRGGVTFGGQSIDGAGRWQGRLVAPPVPDPDGRSQITVPAGSAALLSTWR